MDFNEMKEFHKGKSDDGIDNFVVPLKPDEDGLIGRECTNKLCQTKYFKISNSVPDTVTNYSDMDLRCPYCGITDTNQHFHTENQIEWIKSMLMKDAMTEIQRMFSKTFSGLPTAPTNSMFSINVKYNAGKLPEITKYVEDKLKTIVVCDMCEFKYAVYGLSFHCPLCGKGNLKQHLNTNSNIIRVLIEESSRIGKERGEAIGNKMVGNALEDVVGVFEGFLKFIYKYSIRKKFDEFNINKKLDSIKTDFQRIDRARQLYNDDLNLDIMASINNTEQDFLQEQFFKRHVLTHNLGLVDEKYQEKIKEYIRPGSELEIKAEDVIKAIEVVEKIIIEVDSKMISN